MLEELRLYPRAPAARTGGCLAAGGAGIDQIPAGHNLSTGYAEQPWPGSTGAWSPIHSARSQEVGG
jgi:hypothetical protein